MDEQGQQHTGLYDFLLKGETELLDNDTFHPEIQLLAFPSFSEKPYQQSLGPIAYRHLSENYSIFQAFYSCSIFPSLTKVNTFFNP